MLELILLTPSTPHMDITCSAQVCPSLCNPERLYLQDWYQQNSSFVLSPPDMVEFVFSFSSQYSQIELLVLRIYTSSPLIMSGPTQGPFGMILLTALSRDHDAATHTTRTCTTLPAYSSVSCMTAAATPGNILEYSQRDVEAAREIPQCPSTPNTTLSDSFIAIIIPCQTFFYVTFLHLLSSCTDLCFTCMLLFRSKSG